MLGRKGKDTDWANMPLADMCRGNALDSYFTLKAHKVLAGKIDKLGMTNLYQKLISPAISMFVDMEMKGMTINPGVVKDLGDILNKAITESEDKLISFKEVKDKSLSLTSIKDLTSILYSCDKKKNIIPGGFGLFPPIETDKGAPSTSAEALELLLAQINEELGSRDE